MANSTDIVVPDLGEFSEVEVIEILVGAGERVQREDGLITLDDTTGLLWLDLSLTENLSYVDVLNGAGNSWIAEGWRYATTAEICSLFSTYVAAVSPCPGHENISILEAANLLVFMDANNESLGGLNGFFDDGFVFEETEVLPVAPVFLVNLKITVFHMVRRALQLHIAAGAKIDILALGEFEG